MVQQKRFVSLEQVLTLAKQLTPVEKIQLIESVMPDLKTFLQTQMKSANINRHPLRSAYGICADLGPAPSAEDIDEMRREVFKNFPREDF